MKNANNFFGSANGSPFRYGQSDSEIMYTEGVKDMADACGAYWLIDLVISHQLTKSVRFEPFQVWQLKESKG